MMKLTILGSGTLYPRNDAGSAGYLLQAGDEQMLFDTGLGTLHKLKKLDVDVRKIKHIFYSHTHNDHTCELAPLLWYLHFALKQHPDDPVNQQIGVNLYGPKGFKEFFDILWSKILGIKERPSFIKSVNELESDTVEIGSIKVHSEPVKHIGFAIGFRLEHEGKSFVYSGDTEVCDGLKRLSSNADLLLLECAFPKGKSFEGHMNTTQCGRFAKESNARRLVLTHMYPETLDADARAEAAEEFKGDIIVAKDLMSIKI